MYKPNDQLIDGHRVPNIFNTADKAFHDKYSKPIRGFWNMTKVLQLESLIDETINMFVDKLETKFASTGDACMADDWLTWWAWDVTANVSFGRHYGFIEQERDVENLISESTNGLYYFAPVRKAFPSLT